MRRLDAGALAVDLGPGVGEVALHVLDAASDPEVDAPFSRLLQAKQDVVLDLHVPGVVELARLEHGPCCGHGVAAALHLQRIEEGPIGHVVVRVQLAAHDVAGLEVHEAIRPGADGFEVGGRLTRLRPRERLEHVLGDDLPAVAAEGVGPEGLGLLEDHLDGVAIELVDAADLAVRAAGHGSGGGVGDVVIVEDHIVGGKGLAVVPGHVALEAPGDRGEVLGQQAVLHARDLRREHRGQVALGIVGGERLVEDAAGVDVLGARREMWIEQGWRLPPQDTEGTAAASPGWREGRCLGLSVSHSRRGQHLNGQGGGEAKPHDRLHEGAPGGAARLDVGDHIAKDMLVHGNLHWPSQRGQPPGGLPGGSNPSRVSCTARLSASGVKGLARNAAPEPGTP